MDLGSRRPKEMLQSFKFVWGHWNPINIALQFEWRVEAGRQMLYLAGSNTDRSTWNEPRLELNGPELAFFFKGGGGAVVKSVSIKGRGLRAIAGPGARSSNCVFVDEREKATHLAAPARSAGCS